MVNSNQINYLLRESFSGFSRRKLTTGVTILIMGAALLILALLTLVTLNLDQLLRTARSNIDMRVFLQDGLNSEEIAQLQPRLIVIPGVQNVSFVSSDIALQEFRAQLGADADILDILETNPLPDSFLLEFTPGFRNLAAVRVVSDEISAWPEVGELVYNQGWIDSLEKWSQRFQVASLVVSLIVFLAAVFVISNTVKLTMASSSRVIQVQKLVGATNAFIRAPFLAEGMIQAFLAGVLAMGVLAGASHLLMDRLSGLVFFNGAQIGGFILFCVVLCFSCSWAAMRKYLTMESGICYEVAYGLCFGCLPAEFGRFFTVGHSWRRYCHYQRCHAFQFSVAGSSGRKRNRIGCPAG